MHAAEGTKDDTTDHSEGILTWTTARTTKKKYSVWLGSKGLKLSRAATEPRACAPLSDLLMKTETRC
jgi:hypothetical protein